VVETVGLRFIADRPQVADGLKLLKGLRTGIAPCVFFDPQYRGALDHLDYGNEGVRQQGRAALPQMSDDAIKLWLMEIARVLRPSRYCFLWVDKFHLCENSFKVNGLECVDLITWDKGRIGMGYRTRRKCEYLKVLQKPEISIKGWTDHGIPDVWPERAGGHPHAKPFELQRSLIASVTDPGEFVIDPCAGRYSVMQAAHACGRKFMGCDLIPYMEVSNGNAEASW
jgi:site-specific DNA-methyltransferase (adenine-specific)